MAVSAPVDELKPDETVIDMVGNISLHHSSGTPSITTGAGVPIGTLDFRVIISRARLCSVI